MLTLVRFAYLPDVTLGWLRIGDIKFATLEEGWSADPDGPGGQRREGGLTESCIPDGVYDLSWIRTPHHPDGVYCFSNPSLGVYLPGRRPAGQAWGREACELHSGNSVLDIEGCTLAGFSHGMDTVNSRHIIGRSRDAIARIHDLVGTSLQQILIRPSAGTTEVV